MQEPVDDDISWRPPREPSRAWFIAARFIIWTLMYLVCWFFAYVIVNDDTNAKLISDYFVMAWTFNAGERPLFVQLISLLLFAAAITVALIRRGILARHERRLKQIREGD